MTDSPQEVSKLNSFKAIGRFFKLAWWRHALAFTLAFSRYFKAPIILSTLGSLLVIGALNLVIVAGQPTADGYTDGNKLFPALVTATAGSIVAGILMLIALGIIAMRIAAFIRAFLKFPASERQFGNSEYKKKIEQALEDGLKTVRANKGTLVKSWLTSTIMAVPLLFCWCACSTVVTGLSPQVVEQYRLPAEQVNHLRQISGAGLLIIGLILSNYSMAVMAMSTMLNKSVKEITIDSLWLSIVASPALSLISAFTFAATYAITTPYAVPPLFHPAVQNSNLTINYTTYLWQIWQGISSMIVIPISVAMLCEILRDSVVPLES